MYQRDSQSSYFKYKRRRSQRACQTCNKRKVRCDVTSKNYPDEKCTNCEEFGIKCVVSERKRKRTKAEIEAAKAKILTSQQQADRSDLDSSNEELDEDTTKTSIYRKRKKLKEKNNIGETESSNLQMVDPFRPMTGDEIFIDFDSMLIQEVDSNSLLQNFRLLFPNSAGRAIKQSLAAYYKSKIKVTLGHLISKEFATILRLSGCFILPPKEKCMKYIESYFNSFHQYCPCLNSLQFLQDFRDLSNPPSLLMIRSMLYLGCRVLAKTQEEKDETVVLHEKAKLVYSAKIETNGIYLVLSILMLGLPPSSRPFLKGIENSLDTAIRVATAFDMHKDMTNNPSLSESDKRAYKRIVCFLTIKDRAFAFCFSKKFSFDLASCTVKPLVYSDFDDCGVENQAILFEGASYFMQAQVLIDKVCSLHRSSNEAGLNLKPFAHLTKYANQLVEDFETNVSEPFQKRTDFCFISLVLQSSILSLKVFVARLDYFRCNAIAEKLVMKQPLTEETLNYLRKANLSVDKNMTDRITATHKLADIISKGLVKFRNCLPFCQDMILSTYQCMCYSTVLLFHHDESVRKQARYDIQRVTVILEEVPEVMNSPPLEAVYYILKQIVPDTYEVVRYSRLNFNSGPIEALVKAIKDTKDEGLIMFASRHLPNYMSPLLNLDDEMRYAAGPYERVNINVDIDESKTNYDYEDSLLLGVTDGIGIGDIDFLKGMSPIQRSDYNTLLNSHTTPASEILAGIFSENAQQFPPHDNVLSDPLMYHQGDSKSTNISRTPPKSATGNGPGILDLLATQSPQRLSHDLHNILNPGTPTSIHPALNLDTFSLHHSLEYGNRTLFKGTGGDSKDALGNTKLVNNKPLNSNDAEANERESNEETHQTP